ncbi:MAPEG family protein [Fulvimarina sp. MAC8]|uniref:MAPEG family protein n=1 Tax=Fulvimarina sp. MAC8 TaxID=3162874 RepID=UPI0032EDC165
MADTTALGAVAIYCGLNIAILFWLSFAIGRIRIRHQIMIGDGGNAHLAKAMRGHANAVEIMPMTLLAMTLAGLLGAWPLVIHVLGLALTIGRLLHGLHFTQMDAPLWQRMVGFGLSMASMLASAATAVFLGLSAL